MQILACEVWACAESKISRFSDTAVWTFIAFSPSLSFFLLLDIKKASYFGGKNFRKAFRILGLDERKGRWVDCEQDFHGNFQVNVTYFLAFFSGVLD